MENPAEPALIGREKGEVNVTQPLFWTSDDGTLHERYAASIVVRPIGGLGSFEYDSGRANLKWTRSGVCYFCRHCGNIWAWLNVANSAGEPQQYEPVVVSCEEHPDAWNIPGSLLSGHVEALLPYLPEAAVRREFNLHLNYFSKEASWPS